MITNYAAISVCEKGQLQQQAWHLSRAMQWHGFVPNEALHLLRAVQRQAIGPQVIASSAAISACEKGQLQ